MSSIQNISIRPLRIDEAKAVYLEHAHRDFPAGELKPFSMIEMLWKQGCYRAYGFYEDMEGEDGGVKKEKQKLRAYAFIMADSAANMLLLDYFAVCGKARGKGFGTAALGLLKEECMEWDGIIFEVEDDEEDCTEEERQIRKKRIAFYERNGVVMTDVRSYVFGVAYKLMVLCLGSERAGKRLGEKLASVYRRMLPEAIFEKEFRLR
ncbi:MAG: hypothetical protein NC318_01575 [Blautia sp.]|nr:hypothetical protein [Lachnoclostridium sp.]MCM1210271.1 hypothetical protein [Blautia sp.]